MVKAPFIKIETTKFTEVGYVGRDVDSIIRDLLEISIKMLRTEKRKEVESVAVESAENRIIHALVGESASEETKAKFLMKLKGKVIDDKEIEISIAETQNLNMPSFDIPGGQIGAFNITDLLGKTMGGGKHKTLR